MAVVARASNRSDSGIRGWIGQNREVSAIFLVLVDLLCRVAVSPQVLPLGVVTSLVGAPFFLWLLRRSRSGAMAR